MKLILLKNPDTLICLWILVFPIGIMKIRPHVNVVCDIIPVPYMITDVQAPETLYYLPRGAKWTKWNTWFSAPHNAKKKSA